MDTLYMVVGGVIVVLIVWLMTSGPSNKLYRCQKCGFETTSELEAVGHEKMENSHKVVKE